MWQIFKKKSEKKAAEGSKATRKDMIALTLSVIIVFFVLNFLSSRHFVRWDLTAEKEYSLSDSTRETLENLDDVVNIMLYFSTDLPSALLRLRRDVTDILSEYKTYAGGKLNVQYIDPEETPQKEQQVRMLGIPPVQVNVIEKDKQELVKVYLGIAVVYEGRREIIPVVQGIGSLEYDLTSAILKVSSKSTPVLKWFSMGSKDEFGIIKGLLKKRYTVKDVSEDLDLDSQKDSPLVVVADRQLTESQLFSLDQFLMKGGKILLMVDAVEVGSNLQTTPVESNIFEWLEVNKIKVIKQLLLDHANTHAAFSGGQVTYHMPYPYWVRVTKPGFDEENPIVSGLDSLILPWVSPIDIEADRPEGVDYTILAKSSPFNTTVDLDSSLMPEDSKRLLGRPEVKPKPLIVLAQGKLISYFSGGKVKPPVEDAEVIGVAEGAQLIVIGNSRFIQDNFLRQFQVNSLFFENAVDYLAMGNQLIGIRSRGTTDRPISEMSSAGISVVKYINILGASILLSVVGFIVWFLRRQRKSVLNTVNK